MKQTLIILINYIILIESSKQIYNLQNFRMKFIHNREKEFPN